MLCLVMMCIIVFTLTTQTGGISCPDAFRSFTPVRDTKSPDNAGQRWVKSAQLRALGEPTFCHHFKKVTYKPNCHKLNATEWNVACHVYRRFESLGTLLLQRHARLDQNPVFRSKQGQYGHSFEKSACLSIQAPGPRCDFQSLNLTC